MDGRSARESGKPIRLRSRRSRLLCAEPALAYNPRMKIVLNGESREVTATTSLAQLLEQSGYGTRRVAVEVNREIVPRSRHAERRLAEGDRIEIVHAIGGG